MRTISVFCFVFMTSILIGQTNTEKNYIEERDSLNAFQSDSMLNVYTDRYERALKTKDTLGQIQNKRLLGTFYNSRLDFSTALQNFSEALLLSEAFGATLEQAITLSQLSRMHRRFGNTEDAQRYAAKAHNLRKACIAEEKCPLATLIPSYISFIHFARQENNYDLALKYLDSCFAISERIKQRDIEKHNLYQIKASIYIDKGMLNEAETILRTVENFYSALPPEKQDNLKILGQNIVLYYNLGKIYVAQQKIDLALFYCLKAFKLSINNNIKLNYQPAILTQLVLLYETLGDYKSAYLYLKKAKTLEDEYFKTNSIKNRQFLTLRDGYQEALDSKERELIESQLELSNKEGAILRFRILLLVIVLMVTVGGLLIRNRIAKIKYSNRETLMQESAKEKAREAKLKLEYKNKELASYALQLMERDDLLDKFSEYVNANDNTTEAKSLVIARKKLVGNAWDAFEKRFVAVNKTFYATLSEHYPELTVNDLKYAALLKLNLSGKEISKLLGVSDKSVHMARYRIRKKMGLKTGDDLEAFLATY